MEKVDGLGDTYSYIMDLRQSVRRYLKMSVSRFSCIRDHYNNGILLFRFVNCTVTQVLCCRYSRKQSKREAIQTISFLSLSQEHGGVSDDSSVVPLGGDLVSGPYHPRYW